MHGQSNNNLLLYRRGDSKMKDKLKIVDTEVIEWLRSSWQVYASQSIRGKLARFWVNMDRDYRVTYDGEILYEGVFLSEAIRAWEKI